MDNVMENATENNEGKPWASRPRSAAPAPDDPLAVQQQGNLPARADF
jgi:hypothetical protein